MTRKQLSLVAGLVILTLPMLLACASGGGAPAGPSDEELVQQIILTNLNALAAGDIDTVVGTYADDFSSDQGMDKEGIRAFLQGAADQGFLEGMTSNTEEMNVMVDGDTATVDGIVVEGAFGVLNLGFGLAKRDGQWVVTSQTQQ